MANKTTAQKTATTNNNTTKTAASGLFAMRPAIIQAHNSNNKAAITFDDCEDLKITRQTYDQWVAYVSRLREVTYDYMTMTLNRKATKQTLSAAEGAVYAAWKDVLSNAEGPKFSKNWFVRTTDVHWILYCVIRNVNTIKGSQYGAKSEINFRREIERLVGVRMLSNSILTDKEAEVISAYDKAVATEKRLKTLLEEGDKNTPSLLSQRSNLEKKVEDMTTFFNAFLSKEDEDYSEKFEKAIQPYKSALKDIREQVKRTRKGIESAQGTQKEHQAEYDKIIAKIDKIEA